MSQNSSEIMEKTRKAVLKAGEIIKDNWNEPKDVKYKGRIDLVTQTDLEVEEELKESLSRISPQAEFWAEESASSVKDSDLCWIIDPLDGTTNFAHSLVNVAISVALWQNSWIKLGIVYIPVTGEVFQAMANMGAYLNDQPISVSQTPDLDRALIATGFPYDIREKPEQVINPLRNVLVSCRGVRRMGAAAIDLAYTACGRFDGFYEMGLQPWDTAAGLLLVQEARGKVTQFSPLKEYHLQAPNILASNGTIHNVLGNLLSYS